MSSSLCVQDISSDVLYDADAMIPEMERSRPAMLPLRLAHDSALLRVAGAFCSLMLSQGTEVP